MRPTSFDLRRLAAIYAGGVLGALARVGLAQATAARRRRLALGDLRGQHGRRAGCSATSSPASATTPRTASPTPSSPPGSAAR